MNDSRLNDEELVSALADGQLDAQDMARGLDLVAGHPEARYCWNTYHLIGDILRAPDLAATTPSSEFMQRLSLRLAQEPAPVAQAAQPSANDDRFAWRFKLAAGFASLAVMALGAWLAVGAAQDPAQGPLQARLATIESMPPRVGMIVTGTDKGPMLRDPALDEMLATHRQLGDVTALQAPAAGLHNATFEPADR